MFRDKDEFKEEFIKSVKELTGESIEESTIREQYQALAKLVMKNIAGYMADSHARMNGKNNKKRLYYFSMEFLIGKMLDMNLINLGIHDLVAEGLKELDIDLKEIEAVEKDAGLGNGGLGRLAACFMDSLSFLNIPAIGMGLRYRYGLFEQKIIDGRQVEVPDRWLANGNQWELKKTAKSEIVKFYGHVKTEMVDGQLQFMHENYEAVLAMPYDIPIVDYDTKDVNYLRLWSAESVDDFDLSSFNRGNYLNAVRNKAAAEAITHVLYPNDANEEGRILRLKQQYFFVSAGLKSIIRRYKNNNEDFSEIQDKIQIQINDTHPSLVIPELMRILMDEEGLGWDESWEKTSQICAYTNHTILPEALETWSISMMQQLLPRVYMIIEEINRRFVYDGADEYRDLRIRNSIIREGMVHMANLAIIGSKSVNGVAALHTNILINETFRELYQLYPKKFNSKTNGVSHRRFMLKANPELSQVITDAIGTDWKMQPEKLTDLNFYVEDKSFQDKIQRVKNQNKEKLARLIYETNHVSIDPQSIYDVHIKRIHEYKRQLMNALHIMALFKKIKYENYEIHPRTFIFSGKAAPGYYMAKKIIQLITSLEKIVNQDKKVNQFMKVVFLENFNVTLAEKIYPAADVSQQISTASKEASGTGNMKFMMNGALTLGTLDGANVEIVELVGEENAFIFGLKSEEVIRYYQKGGYHSYHEYENNPDLKVVVNYLVNGFLQEDISEFKDLYDHLISYNDPYFVLKDFEPYKEAQERLNNTYMNQSKWLSMVIANIASSGYFSSDRTILDYNRDIWKIQRGSLNE